MWFIAFVEFLDANPFKFDRPSVKLEASPLFSDARPFRCDFRDRKSFCMNVFALKYLLKIDIGFEVRTDGLDPLNLKIYFYFSEYCLIT